MTGEPDPPPPEPEGEWTAKRTRGAGAAIWKGLSPLICVAGVFVGLVVYQATHDACGKWAVSGLGIAATAGEIIVDRKWRGDAIGLLLGVGGVGVLLAAAMYSIVR